ncbi:MAG: gluconolaconase, partial [Gemmatimonadota bacterium]|nr:gluconolaconase [Gemmatimonadota bacterium]
AVGPDGTAYVTDSMTPVIYAVSTEGAVDVLLRDGPLAEGGFLNGIDFHPDGHLLVALAGARALLKIDLEPEPTISTVSIPEPFSADGLTLTPEGALIAVATTGDPEAPRSEVLRLTSDDGWASASIEDRADAADAATTAAVREGAVYVLDARFGDMGADEPAPHFDITRVRFP